jgi:hypothetical protein
VYIAYEKNIQAEVEPTLQCRVYWRIRGGASHNRRRKRGVRETYSPGLLTVTTYLGLLYALGLQPQECTSLYEVSSLDFVVTWQALKLESLNVDSRKDSGIKVVIPPSARVRCMIRRKKCSESVCGARVAWMTSRGADIVSIGDFVHEWQGWIASVDIVEDPGPSDC